VKNGKAKKTTAFSQAELQEKFRKKFAKTLSRQRLHQLRNGYKVRGKEYDPKLIEDVHFFWDRGNLKYLPAAFKFIQDQSTKLTSQS